MSVLNTHLGANEIARKLHGKRSVFFLGIGGISMSGLAHITKANGFVVGGSDRAQSAITDRLCAEGIQIFIGHSAQNAENYDALVYTVAVRDDTPELVRARERGIPVISRADYLGYLMSNYTRRIGISGMHGKSSTTSMVTEIFLAAAAEPTVVSGAELSSIGGAYRVGGSENFIFEACEYMDSFLDFYPTIAVILNIELDHVDYFKSMEHIRRSFRSYMEKTKGCGCAVLNADDEQVMQTAEGFTGSTLTFGIKNNADITAKNITHEGGRTSFDLCHGSMRRPIHLSVCGNHHVYNALAAAACAILAGIPSEYICRGLKNFKGAKRRFEYKGELCGAKIYDDYAHHPTEITATLCSARGAGAKRVICVYQPHTFSRTKGLFDEFVTALSGADIAVIADIYAARETDDMGMSAKLLADKIGEKALYLGGFENIAEYIKRTAQEGDFIFTMGAGDITNLSAMLLK